MQKKSPQQIASWRKEKKNLVQLEMKQNPQLKLLYPSLINVDRQNSLVFSDQKFSAAPPYPSLPNARHLIRHKRQ